MAKFADFPESNVLMKGDGDQIGDLKVYTDNTQFVSCWELSSDEIQTILETGKVWLYILGDRHPPVYVTGLSPFERPVQGPDLAEPADESEGDAQAEA